MATKLLLVDDDAESLELLRLGLNDGGFEVETAHDGEAALHAAEASPFDMVITDLAMPKLDGMGLLTRLHSIQPLLPVIVVTSSHEVSRAVEAMHAGAANYLTKPVDIGALEVAIQRALEGRNLRAEATRLQKEVDRLSGAAFEGLVGVSPAMQKTFREATKVAASRATVLVTGESGTGKGELARAIHDLSARKGKPFVSLHCAALAEGVLESELFGHEKGSFTGADRVRIGRFELAHGGTLFLDEIGEIPSSLQVKLLRVLQERCFERVGGNESITVDVRLIAATNRDLAADVRAGRFREDLYYRLNVVNIEMPPLRVRGNDVLLLAEHFLRRFASENKKDVGGFSADAREKILGARWPGNVRELENAVERAVIMCQSSVVRAEDIPVESSSLEAHDSLRIPGATMQELERYAIVKTLEAVNGSTTRAAKILNIGARTIQYRLHQYHLARRRPGRPPLWSSQRAEQGGEDDADGRSRARRRHDA